MMPVIRSLLVREVVDDTGLVVTVADATGRLLWVEGDQQVMGLAEALRVVPGADWSETGAGTNAPGTALTLDRRVQIVGDEHFAVHAQQLSCTAVPIRDLDTMETIGVLDITGGPAAVGTHSLPLLAATVAAAERELLSGRAREGGAAAATRAGPRAPRGSSVLGRGRAVLSADGRCTSPLPPARRAAHPARLAPRRADGRAAGRADPRATGSRCRAAGDDEAAPPARGRRALPGPAIARPYRLPEALEIDARRMVSQLDRGANRAALAAYEGPVLPGSVAPGIVEIRREVDARLRETLLQTASPDLLLPHADRIAPRDAEPLSTVLQLLPLRSPKRAAVVARLEALA